MLSLLAKHKKTVGDVLVAALLLLLFIFNAFSYLEHKLQDAVYQKPTSADPDIIVIGIDVETLDELGTPDQWSRQLMADAINILNSSEDYKPAVIAVDILYVGERADRQADQNLVDAVKNGGNVVLASRAVTGDVQSPSDPSQIIRATVRYEKPFPALAECASFGNVNAIFDNDSVVRTTTLKYGCDDEVVYSFPYEICQKYIGGESDGFSPGYDDLYITYYGMPGDYKQFSFSDIFKDPSDPEYLDPEFLADCIVLIGPYAPGLMDSYQTPVDTELMNGVEIHANIVQMLLEENFKAYPPVEVDFVIFLSIIVITMMLARFLDIRLLLAVYAAMAVAYFVTALILFDGGVILALMYPLSALVLAYIYQLIYGYVLETLEKQKVKNTFKKYVDPKLVDKLIESGEANSDAVGMKKDIAVLFVDVRGFTPMTEALKDNPELVVKILNEYLELTSGAVFHNGGSVDKFIGDATMALFNGFVPLDDYVYKAVKAAWDIVQGASEVNAALKEKYNVDVGFGVGVNCGSAIVGNLGPSFRKDYTAIGDTVNTAARLESNAKRSEVLISKAVFDAVGNRIAAESVGAIPLKGKNIKLEVFTVTNVFE